MFIIRVIIGIVFLILGVLGLFLPVLQGLLFIFLGLALLFPNNPYIRSALQKLKERYPKQADRLLAIKTRLKRFLRRNDSTGALH